MPDGITSPKPDASMPQILCRLCGSYSRLLHDFAKALAYEPVWGIATIRIKFGHFTLQVPARREYSIRRSDPASYPMLLCSGRNNPGHDPAHLPDPMVMA